MSTADASAQRRDVLRLGLGGLGFAGLALALSRGAAADSHAASGHGAPLPLLQWGDFDLSSRAQRKLARLKVLNSLDGQRTYFYTITRHTFCPPGKTPYPLLAEMELFTLWLEHDAGMADHEVRVRAIFTRTALDPQTFQPVGEYTNPYSGRTLPLQDTLFAGGGRIIDLRADSADDPITQADRPHYRIGDDIEFVMFDPRDGEGDFQPRVDTVVWRANHAALMDPAAPSVDAHYSFSAVLRANVYPWSGLPKDDTAQMLTTKTGTKVGSLSALPSEVRSTLVAKYPDRV